MLATSLIALFATTSVMLAILVAGLHDRLQRKPPQAAEPALPLPAHEGHCAGDERWSEFLIGMSHELRTPMNAVIGFTEMLLEADLPDTQQQRVRLIADSGRAMLRLVNDILDVARIKAGQLRLAEEDADLAEELGHAVALMQPIAAAQGLSLTLTVTDGVPPRLQFDRLRLRQVVLNLIGNALKFTDQGGVDVSLANTAEGLQIAVSDSGMGIAADRLPTLFTPFAAPHSAQGRQFGGTGLGLPICDQLVRLMRGSITVLSKPGQGSTFTVRLPLRETEPTPVQPPATAPNRPTRSLQGLRVLVAEDHPINQQLILAMAGALGLAAELATDGNEAVAMALQAREAGLPFRVVLMDVQMPRMDGLAAARALRAAGLGPGELPIIALTANCYADDIAAARAAGMQAHLAKPLMLADLERTLIKHAGSEPEAAATDDLCNVLRQPEGITATIHSLDHRYRQRKQELLGLLETALAPGDAPPDWPAIASGLHRLAGIAANFGDGPLGELARMMERELQGAGDNAARHAILAREFPALRAAA